MTKSLAICSCRFNQSFLRIPYACKKRKFRFLIVMYYFFSCGQRAVPYNKAISLSAEWSKTIPVCRVFGWCGCTKASPGGVAERSESCNPRLHPKGTSSLRSGAGGNPSSTNSCRLCRLMRNVGGNLTVCRSVGACWWFQ